MSFQVAPVWFRQLVDGNVARCQWEYHPRHGIPGHRSPSPDGPAVRAASCTPQQHRPHPCQRRSRAIGRLLPGQAFVVLTGDDLPRFWAVGGEAAVPSVRDAPLVIIPMSSKRIYLDRYARPDKGWTDRDERRWPVPFWHIDTGMATLLILQIAVDEGLSACYFGVVPEASTMCAPPSASPVITNQSAP